MPRPSPLTCPCPPWRARAARVVSSGPGRASPARTREGAAGGIEPAEGHKRLRRSAKISVPAQDVEAVG